MEILIKEKIGSRCITKNDGQKLYDLISPKLKAEQSVSLDFSGVNQFASPFFNFAIGQLLNDLTAQQVKDRLHIENLNGNGQLVVERVMENASRYHKDLNYRQIVDTILQQQAEEMD